MRSVAEYQRLGGIPEIVAAVAEDRDAEWRSRLERADLERATAVLEAERARTELAAARTEAYDAGYRAGLERAGVPRRRRVERDDQGLITAVVDEPAPALRAVPDTPERTLQRLIDEVSG